METTKQQIIKEIAQDLDCGSECYYNFKTNEIIAIPDFSQVFDEDVFKEAFGEALERVEQQKADFIKIEPLESFESFKIMECFVAQLTDQNFKLKLQAVLQRKKPFQNFKHQIEQSNFRQDWFDFKQLELEKIVAKKLH
ncbi:UPF0158 family protein [Polaribacter undariae]|uniref:UPF0158 family protein n=1 Tax=Polaribacter sejongensis TaxID=985043 RepID=A0AAJ1QYA3_9FLAO|nr:UPF0158 family protein [Polaribacter undariae]MDN3620362.1 UPF0158 family protein [Polaribacter undariae]UWD32763.1 UPF0158 family protein [Polaribacter undariae]